MPEAGSGDSVPEGSTIVPRSLDVWDVLDVIKLKKATT